MTAQTKAKFTSPKSWILLAVFLIVVQLVGFLIGTANTPGAWYEALDKPFFNPPNWIFGPVWSALYVLIAIAGWLIAIRAPLSLAMGLWVVQMILNWFWSPAFFGAENLALALAIIVPMLLAIIAFIIFARRISPAASWLFVPYALWVSFATLLNLSLLILN